MFKLRVLCLLSLALTLTGCKANITYRFDLHPDSTVTVAINEKVDDQFFNLARSQSKDGDPFGLDAAKRSGWIVARSVTDDGDRLNSMTRTVALSALKDSLGNGSASPGMISAPLTSFNPAAVSTTVGLITDKSVVNATFPALMPKSGTDSENAYAGAAAAMVSSIISMHLELKAPGKIIYTNGDMTPDGAVRWNLNLQSPTSIEYTVQSVNIPHIIIGIAALMAAALIFFFARRRAKRTTTLNAEPT
jgi:hypothetical protein